MANGNDILEFGFEDTVSPPSVPLFLEAILRRSMCAPVKVLARADSDNRICVCECGKDTNFVGVFKLRADSHGC
jgi:hypothetical protein